MRPVNHLATNHTCFPDPTGRAVVEPSPVGSGGGFPGQGCWEMSAGHRSGPARFTSSGNGTLFDAVEPVPSRAMVKKGGPKTSDGNVVVASNRRARRDYDILDTYECGLVLTGSEVKSLREANVQLVDGFARVERNEMWLFNVTISPWLHSSAHSGHLPERKRKLLMHRSEINRIRARVDQERLSLIPLQIYFKDGRAKIEIALGKGRKMYDKRNAIAKRESDLEAQRAMRRYSR